jgi:hypothetical protein
MGSPAPGQLANHETAGAPPAPAESHGNGGHGSPPPEPAREPAREPAAAREQHSEPRQGTHDPGSARDPAPIAHFEPQPKPEADPGKPYVVWSSAPPREGGERGTEE